MWDLGQEYQAYKQPSIHFFILEQSEGSDKTPFQVACDLLHETRWCEWQADSESLGEDEPSEEGVEKEMKGVHWEALIEEIAEGMDSMTNGSHMFLVGKGGKGRAIQVCEEDYYQSFYA